MHSNDAPQRETYRVYCRVGAGQHYISIVANSKAAAQADAESRGHDVIKVRRMPVPRNGGRHGGRI